LVGKLPGKVAPVDLTCFGALDAALAEALGREGFDDVDRLTLSPDGDSVAALAAALREAGLRLAERSPDAVLVTGAGDAALAAALTAVKLDIPTAWLGEAAGELPLVARVAPITLDATASAAENSLAIRDLAESKITSP
jgi:hypothetical protein